MSNKQPPATQNGRNLQLSDDTLRQMIEVQTREQALRGQELQIRTKEIEHQSKHASEILEAQERDREKERDHNRRIQKGRLITGGIITTLVLVFVGAALFMNKDSVVLEITKLVLAFLAGGAGGYGISQSKNQNKSQNDEE